MRKKDLKSQVAIIGAGPGGLTAVKCLLEAGLNPTAFERSPTIGGLWNFDENLSGGGGIAYRSLKTNTSKQLTAFSDFPFPPGTNDFPPREEVLHYLNAYADHFNLRPYIRQSSTVVSANQTDRGWNLRVQRNGDDEETLEFDSLIVANGFYQHPFIPDIPGLRDFKGDVVHSMAYKGPERFAGKRVVVIGTGSSGADIAAEVSELAKSVEASTKTGVWFSPHFVDGKPADLNLNRLERLVPARLKQYNFRKMLSNNFKQMGYTPEMIEEKLRLPKFKIANTRITRGTKILAQILENRVILKPEIECIEGKIVEYADGTRSEADVLVFCTGFTPDLPFLSPEIIDFEDTYILKLYRHVFHPTVPQIAFIGLSRVAGPVLPVMEMQARWIAQIFSGKLKLPGSSFVGEAIQNHIQKSIKNGKNPMQIRYAEYMEEVAGYIGVRPKLFSHPKLIRKLLFGPLISAQYRLDGPGKSEAAAKIISETGNRNG